MITVESARKEKRRRVREYVAAGWIKGRPSQACLEDDILSCCLKVEEVLAG